MKSKLELIGNKNTEIRADKLNITIGDTRQNSLASFRSGIPNI